MLNSCIGTSSARIVILSGTMGINTVGLWNAGVGHLYVETSRSSKNSKKSQSLMDVNEHLIHFFFSFILPVAVNLIGNRYATLGTSQWAQYNMKMS